MCPYRQSVSASAVFGKLYIEFYGLVAAAAVSPYNGDGHGVAGLHVLDDLGNLVNGAYLGAVDGGDGVAHNKFAVRDRKALVNVRYQKSGQFKSQHMDSRRELEQLKQTRQKIGYYNSAVVGRATGQSLNKNL